MKATTLQKGSRANNRVGAPPPARPPAVPPKGPGHVNAARKAEETTLAIHIGQRIRARRKMLGISQEKLGDALGLTFQQVQKYEKGTNRVSAPTLIKLAGVLEAPIIYFLPVDGEPPMPDLPPMLLTRAENLAHRIDRLADELAELVAELRNRKH